MSTGPPFAASRDIDRGDSDRNPYTGPQAVAECVCQRLVSEVDRFAVEPKNIIDGGNTVVVEGRYTGTYRETGVPVDAQFAHVWELREGSCAFSNTPTPSSGQKQPAPDE